MEVMETLSDFKNKIACFLKKEKDAYKKMSKADKRVAIAQDVIAQINADVYVPTSGTYVQLNASDIANDKGVSFKDLRRKPADLMMQEGLLTCEVCAKGAMFMSHIKKDSDTCSVDKAYKGSSEQVIENRLTDVFSEEQLDLIEAAFESDTTHYSDDHDNENGFDENGGAVPGTLGYKAEKFGNRYNDDQKRLVAIMKNIIRHKGTFVLK